MAKKTFTVKVMELQDARREFALKQSMGSQYGEILRKAANLGKGKALLAEGLSYSQVTGLRKKVGAVLGEGWQVASTRTDQGKYDVLVTH